MLRRKDGEIMAKMTKLKQIRRSRKLTQSQLSEKSGINLRMIQYYEQGVKNINEASISTLAKLSRSLSCQIEDIIEDLQVIEDLKEIYKS